MGEEKLTGKLILKGRLNLKTPLIIGSGESDVADIVVLKDLKGKPYIPATSFVGLLRHYFEEGIDDNTKKTINKNKQLDYFWGSTEADGYQSALMCNDLKTQDEPKIKVRDGVAIDHKKGIAKKRAKFDYEVVESGIGFDLNMEISIREAYDKEIFKRILKTIVDALKVGDIRVGAMATKGFGECKLEDIRCYEFDFSKKEDVIRWLNGELGKGQELSVEPFPIKPKEFLIDAWFKIKSSLIIKSYSDELEAPDAVHISSKDNPILPGTSLKGVIRDRAIRIINTLERNGEEAIKPLFGWIDIDEEKKNEKYKSRIIVNETIINNTIEEIQRRIKIDRFTGGTIKGALFDSTPLWTMNGDKAVHIIMKINNYEDWEAGLLLLILKDLWNGDLPIGGEKNVGRGILKGLEAAIRIGKDEGKIKQNDDKLVFEGIEPNRFEELVSQFVEYTNNQKEKLDAE